MNVVDCTVLKVLSSPYEKCGCWCVDVKFDCWGNISDGTVHVFTKEEADKVITGYKFQA